MSRKFFISVLTHFAVYANTGLLSKSSESNIIKVNKGKQDNHVYTYALFAD